MLCKLTHEACRCKPSGKLGETMTTCRCREGSRQHSSSRSGHCSASLCTPAPPQPRYISTLCSRAEPLSGAQLQQRQHNSRRRPHTTTASTVPLFWDNAPPG